MSEQPGVFKGASRVSSFIEPQKVDKQPVQEVRQGGFEPAQPQVAQEEEVPAPIEEVEVPKATWGLRGKLAKVTGGLIKPSASLAEQQFLLAEQQRLLAEQEHTRNVEMVRQMVWPRPMSVLVACDKGGVGKTPISLLLGGVLSSLRSSPAVVVEVCESAGYLASRAEGTNRRGLIDLIQDATRVTRHAEVEGFTRPQESRALVLGSPSLRRELTAIDVHNVRELLDTYYTLTVMDSANNHFAPAFMAAASLADAVVVPVLPNESAILAGQRTVERIRQLTTGSSNLHERIVVVTTHDGGPEAEGLAEQIPSRIPAKEWIDLPFDPEIRKDGELRLSRCTEATQRALTRLAAEVVQLLDAADQSRHLEVVRDGDQATG